jgi:hypothetical protein
MTVPYPLSPYGRATERYEDQSKMTVIDTHLWALEQLARYEKAIRVLVSVVAAADYLKTAENRVAVSGLTRSDTEFDHFNHIDRTKKSRLNIRSVY